MHILLNIVFQYLAVRNNLLIFAAKYDDMKKILILLLSLLVTGCWYTSAESEEKTTEIDSVTLAVEGKIDPLILSYGKYMEVGRRLGKTSVIDEMCWDVAWDRLTSEEIAHWDSMNADGGFIFINGADRYLDTIVNHFHMIFRTDE